MKIGGVCWWELVDREVDPLSADGGVTMGGVCWWELVDREVDPLSVGGGSGRRSPYPLVTCLRLDKDKKSTFKRSNHKI